MTRVAIVFEALATKRVGERRETAAFGVGEPQPAAAELGFETRFSSMQIGDHLLLVPLEPAGNHGDEDVENHGVPQVESRAMCALQYTVNLRYFNRVASAVYFNHTRSFVSALSRPFSLAQHHRHVVIMLYRRCVQTTMANCSVKQVFCTHLQTFL